MEKYRAKNMKETSIGLIPEDWEVKSLSQIGVFSKGKGVTRADAQSGDIPCIRYGEIYTSHNDYIREFYSHISHKIAANATKLKKGDILFAGSGETKEEIGKAVAFLGDEEAYAGGDIIILSPNDGVSSKFLGYVLNGAIAVSQKASMGQGDAVVHIHAKELGDVVIPLPNLTEQKRIAAALSGVDDMIGALDETIAKKRQIKEGLMQQLMTGKTRLPGFSGEWREAELKEFGYMIRGVSYKPEDSSLKPEDGYVRLLRSNNIQEGKMVYADYVFVKSANIADYQYMKDGDILICMANGSKQLVGKAARLTRSGVYTFGAFMGVFRCNDKTVCPFVEELLKTGYYRKLLDDILTGSAINNLNGAAVESLKFFVPSDSQEQRAIAAVLCKADDEINGLECQRDKYRLIKQGMMQELLTGKTRL